MITTGEGGAALTNNESLFTKMKLLRTWNYRESFPYGTLEPWEYQQLCLGLTQNDRYSSSTRYHSTENLNHF